MIKNVRIKPKEINLPKSQQKQIRKSSLRQRLAKINNIQEDNHPLRVHGYGFPKFSYHALRRPEQSARIQCSILFTFCHKQMHIRLDSLIILRSLDLSNGRHEWLSILDVSNRQFLPKPSEIPTIQK